MDSSKMHSIALSSSPYCSKLLCRASFYRGFTRTCSLYALTSCLKHFLVSSPKRKSNRHSKRSSVSNKQTTAARKASSRPTSERANASERARRAAASADNEQVSAGGRPPFPPSKEHCCRCGREGRRSARDGCRMASLHRISMRSHSHDLFFMLFVSECFHRYPFFHSPVRKKQVSASGAPNNNNNNNNSKRKTQQEQHKASKQAGP